MSLCQPPGIKLIEKETGKKLKEVMMDVDGAITIKPLIEKKDSVNVACTTVREAEVS